MSPSIDMDRKPGASSGHVLLVEDDPDSARMMSALVRSTGFSTSTAGTIKDARRLVALRPPDVVLLDLNLPDGSGMELLDEQLLPASTNVVFVTGYASLETSIRALRSGASDYLVKPVDLGRLKDVLARFVRTETRTPNPVSAPIAMVGASPVMVDVLRQLRQVGPTSVPVFITGESGTGKELAARAVHDNSQRRSGPFLAVNTAAISPLLVESELFGHERGSFTGAERTHTGYFERAAGGTLFLDEITEMPLELQIKLLRVLESGCFSRVGSTESRQADVRIVAACNRDPLAAVAGGLLRDDLFYRLHVFPVHLPPLRERREDIPLIARYLIERICATEGGAPKQLGSAAMLALLSYDWPGNVRELRNALYRAWVLTPGDLIDAQWLPGGQKRFERADDLVLEAAMSTRRTRWVDEQVPSETAAHGSPAGLRSADASIATLSAPDEAMAAQLAQDGVFVPVGKSLASAERDIILANFEHHGRRREPTATALGVSLKTLYNRLKEYGVK